ncbi:MAG: enoyl-CoA hydratase/isomerase family protein [Phycisphaerales bacterium]|jgi:enoyl-CoA hydratase/carnithine racemase|nr:enoyl-CoA hydratase/isomerase family protein [Phycisphaerales bacterium]
MIHAALEGPVLVVTLRRPEKRNALTREGLRDLARLCEHLRDGAHPESDRVRAVLLRGEGPMFCSGFDLDACRGDPGGIAMRGFLSELSRTIAALRDGPSPVVICAHGGAIAGGCALLGGADVVVADVGAKLGYPVTRIGISPAVSAPFLALHVGLGPARARLLDSGLINGARAHAIGLAHELCPSPDDADERARTIAHELASKPTESMHATRRWLREVTPISASHGLEASLSLVGRDEERRMLEAFWGASR